MVGAIADWFAVTALFRHPLGLPIPHTALIPTRKDALGAAWRSSSVRTSCRRRSSGDRLATVEVAARLGGWLRCRRNARRVTTRLGDRAARWPSRGSATTTSRGGRRRRSCRRRVAGPGRPVAGSLLGEVVADGAHHGLVDLCSTRRTAGWLRQPGDLRRRGRRTGAVVVARRLNDRVTQRLHVEAVRLDRRHGGRPGPPAAAGARRPAGPARATTCCTTRPRRSALQRLKERLLDQPATMTAVSSLVERHPASASWTPLDDAGRGRCGAGRRGRPSFGERLPRDEALRATARRLGLATWRCSSSTRYGDELTA